MDATSQNGSSVRVAAPPGPRLLRALAGLLLIAGGAAAAGAADAPQTVGDLLALAHGGVEHEALYRFYRSDLVEVKFRDQHCMRMRNGRVVDVQGGAAMPPGLDQARAGLGPAVWQRSSPLSEQRVDALCLRARAQSRRTIPDLNNYYRIRVPQNMTAVQALYKLRGIPCFEHVSLVPIRSVPMGSDPTDILNYADPDTPVWDGRPQAYLWPAPVGVDAFYAWESFYGSGLGVTVCDLEIDPPYPHSELDDVTILRRPGKYVFWNPQRETQEHTAAVLGVIGSRADGVGTTGIAYHSGLAWVSEANDFGFSDVPGAIQLAMDALDPGDVLLFEISFPGPNTPLFEEPSNRNLGFVPVSWHRNTYDSIQVATAMGLIVVEPSGNGTQNLDAGVYSNGVGGWPNGQGPFQAGNDSGSIMVGAGSLFPIDEDSEWQRPSFSNYGDAVDVFAMGEQVTTIGRGSLFDAESDNFDYRLDFTGTSSAGAIIAGAAAVMQSLFKDAHERPATAAEMLTLLQVVGTPTEQNDEIGVMPNLRAAIESLAPPAFLTTAPPIPDPAPGPIAGPITLTFSLPTGVLNDFSTSIRFTLDDSDPTMDSYEFRVGDNGLALLFSTTIRAAVFRRDSELNRWFPGQIGEFAYEQTQERVATPTFNPPAGAFPQLAATFPIEILTDTADATIKYRTDGNAFLLLLGIGSVYSSPLELPAGEYNIIAVASKVGTQRSERSERFLVEMIDIAAGVPPQGMPPLLQPSVFPPDGEYTGIVEVSASVSTPDTGIRYTTTGAEPTSSSALYTQPLFFNDAVTFKAKAFFPTGVFSPSATITRSYTVTTNVPPPIISPDGGEFTSSATVTLVTTNPLITIRYTLNGSEPNFFSSAYEGPIELGIGQYALQARSFFPDLPPSGPVEADFRVFSPSGSSLSAPELSPGGGNHTGSVSIEIVTDSENADIRYTVNELRDVSVTDALYVPGLPLVLTAVAGGNNTHIVRARTFQGGSASFQTQVSYNLFTPVGTAADPSMSPPGGVFSNSVPVTFRSDTRGLLFRYTTDGSDPRTSDTARTPNRSSSGLEPSVSFPLSLAKPAVLKVSCDGIGWLPSGVTEGVFSFQCDTPSIEVIVGADPLSAEVTLETQTRSAGIYYTLDGSIPTKTSEKYSAPFTVSASTTFIQARAFRTPFADSDISAREVRLGPPPSAPIITVTQNPVVVEEGQELTIATQIAGDDITGATWTRDGQTLAYLGDAIFIPRAQLKDAGTYQLTLESQGGRTASELIEVVVNPSPIILTRQEQWRLDHFGSITNSGDGADQADPDEDDVTNEDEFNARTDPNDADSNFRVDDLLVGSSAQAGFLFPSVLGVNYSLDTSHDLVAWEKLEGSETWGDGQLLQLRIEPPPDLLFPLFLRAVAIQGEDVTILVTHTNPTEGFVQGVPVAPVVAGERLTLTAIASSGYRFTGWAGDLSGTENPMIVTVTADMNFQPLFEQITYAVAVTADSTRGMVTGVPLTPVPANQQLTLEAVPEPGHRFAEWSGNLDDIGRNPLSFAVTEPVALEALFEPIDFVVSISAYPAEGGTITGPTSAIDQEPIVFAAMANDGYAFDRWSGDVQTSENPLHLTVTQHVALVANFRSLTPIPPAAIRMAAIPGGIFLMNYQNTSNPGDTVTLSAFNLDLYEVTYQEWETIYDWALQQGYTFDENGRNGAQTGSERTFGHPVTDINWYDAVKWANAKSEYYGLTPVYYISNAHTGVYRTGQIDLVNSNVNWTGEGYRLPTEAEWEYAARGGFLNLTYPTGNSIDIGDANYDDNTVNAVDATTPAGSYPPNGYGLFDLAGNIREWTWNNNNAFDPDGTTDPRGPGDLPGFVRRIARGGAYNDNSTIARCRHRETVVPSGASTITGFRLARSRVDESGYSDTAPVVHQFMNLAPGGSFLKESETADVNVTVSTFLMDVQETTYQDWLRVKQWGEANGYVFDRNGSNGASTGSGRTFGHPVMNVSWYDAVKWANARSELIGLRPCYYLDANHTTVYRTGQSDLTDAHVDWTAPGYRLPTEAEWEYAARGNQPASTYPTGSSISQTVANFDDNQPGTINGTIWVRHYPDTGEFDLYDLAGNTREWVWDRTGGQASEGEIDPRGPNDWGAGALEHRLVRGGEWNDNRTPLQNHHRENLSPGGGNAGFRLAVGSGD